MFGGEGFELAVAAFAGNNMLMNHVRVKNVPGGQLAVGDVIAEHLMVKHRKIVGGVKRDDGYAV